MLRRSCYAVAGLRRSAIARAAARLIYCDNLISGYKIMINYDSLMKC